jgi:hypothetical protein
MFDPYDPTDEFVSDGGERRISEEGVPDDPMVPVDANVDIAEDPSQTYNGVQVSRMSMRVTRSRVIYSEYNPDEVVHLVGSFFEQFPTDAALIEQSALWVRFFAGFHFFQDANHRTGMNTLEYAMLRSGIEWTEFNEYDDKTRIAREKSKEIRTPESMGEVEMFRKDRLYRVWKDYFDDVLLP